MMKYMKVIVLVKLEKCFIFTENEKMNMQFPMQIYSVNILSAMYVYIEHKTYSTFNTILHIVIKCLFNTIIYLYVYTYNADSSYTEKHNSA